MTCTQLRSQRATAGLLNLVIDATPPVCVIVVVVDVSVRPILRLEVLLLRFGEPPTQLLRSNYIQQRVRSRKT